MLFFQSWASPFTRASHQRHAGLLFLRRPSQCPIRIEDLFTKPSPASPSAFGTVLQELPPGIQVLFEKELQNVPEVRHDEPESTRAEYSHEKNNRSGWPRTKKHSGCQDRVMFENAKTAQKKIYVDNGRHRFVLG
jgi:hypothetical protein